MPFVTLKNQNIVLKHKIKILKVFKINSLRLRTCPPKAGHYMAMKLNELLKLQK